MKNTAINSQQVNIILSKLLTYMVIASICIILSGAIIYFNNSSASAPLVKYKQLPVHICITNTLQQAIQGNGSDIILSGLLLLILTPVTRVLFLTVNFILQKDWIYSIIGLVILGVIALSCLLGIKH